jgi:hypothetical protein
MQQYENIQQVVLAELNRRSLKRILSIRSYLEQGNVLSSSQLDFLSGMIVKIKVCQRGQEQESDCKTIFTSVSHLISQVVRLALDNEQKESSNQPKL